METLSSTTTAVLYKLPTSTSLHPSTTSLLPPSQPHYNLSSTRRQSFTSSASTQGQTLVFSAKSHLKPHPQPLPFHRRAASGYAAALIDAAQLAGSSSLSAVARDVRRFSKVMRREEIRDLVCDAEVMKLIADEGRFCKQLKVVLDLLVEKGRVGMFGEVLDEFQRIYQLLGFRVAVAS